MKLLHSSLACAALAASAHAQSSVSSDLWDVSQGSVIVGQSEVHPGAGTAGGLLGLYGQDNGFDWTWTYFADEQPEGFVHFVEWETPSDVTVGQVRVFAFGDADAWLNNGREFDQLVIRAKSPSSSTYDLTVLTFAATHPYSFIDAISALVVDEVISPVTARAFRAEFIQYSAGNGWDGPRILEIDGLPVPPPPPPPPPPPRDVPSVSDDAWDVSRGAVVTATSGLHPAVGSIAGFLGENGQNNGLGSTWTYFPDGLPANFVHFVEWETATDVTIGQIRAYALGDPHLNNGREFAQMTIKAKSPGSPTFDATILTFTPTHPYTFLDPISFMILDQEITPITARSFRAEFVQYSAGNNWDGPRIIELDAIAVDVAPPPPPPPPPVVPPVIAAAPQSVVANIYMPVALWIEATGTGALRYQWFKDTVALEGQTSAALMIPSLTASEVGTYHARVTDDVGTTVSAEATVGLDLVNIVTSDFDLWDVRTGATVGAHSDLAAESAAEGMFGGETTLFADGAGHFMEWSTPVAVQVNTVRLFARGDGPSFANLHEFGSFTLKAKSAGSATFDIVVGTFTPAHPYPLLDANTFAILDTEIAPIVASAFRAEFAQFNGGPRILELDAFTTRPLVAPGIVIAPLSQIVQRNANTTLSVLAKGGNLQFQWKFKGQPIVGATGESLTVLKMNRKDEGNYSVVVSNELGSVESAAAVLTISSKH